MYRDIQFFSLSGIRNYVPHQLAYFQDLKSKTLHLMASECKLAFIQGRAYLINAVRASPQSSFPTC
jgi:hypothetical protein